MKRRTRIVIGVSASVLLLAGAGTWFVQSLGPLDLSKIPEQSPVVIDREGKLLRAFTTRDGRWRLPVAAREIDPRFLAMLQAYEDRRFESHHGLDGRALIRAAWQWITHGKIISGGSTLTMQVARLIEPRTERTLTAKLRQVVRAVQLERRFSKPDILDFYVALAPYGGNLEGVRAASFAWFGKEPRRLSVGEAAMLVAMPQAPEMRRPDRFLASARQARLRVLQRAQERGLISPAEAHYAALEPLPAERKMFPAHAAHAADAALRSQPGQKTHRLTIDARMQITLENLLRERVTRLGQTISGAILVADHATGAVRAHIGGPDFLNTERAGGVDMAFAVRSPGSALKPFIYGLAFDNGIAHPETILEDRPSRFGIYAPENFDQTYQGTLTARKALQHSLNIPAVELLAEVGPQKMVTRLMQAGAQITMPKEGAPGLAIGLGGLGVRLVDLVRLYGGLARGGDTVPLVWRGEDSARPEQRRMMEKLSAWYVTDILRGAPPPDHAPAGRFAFKTGTSYGYRDAWAVGYDARHTVAVWLGRPDGAAVPGLIARQVALPILFDAFARIGIDADAPPMPADALLQSTAHLPPPLRHLRKDMPKTLASIASIPLKIAYPPNGARIDLGLRGDGQDREPLVMKASGGMPPFTWLVNGVPLGEAGPRRQSSWQVDGAGFAHVSIIDATGATDSVRVRVE
ncbi:MAG: penicillin-binding protein 1C [Beijerinckiaceae bacterium]